MRIDVLTIFPAMFVSPFSESLLAKAKEKNIIQIQTLDIRQFSGNKHKKVDDKPFGGGVGMVLKPEPIFEAFKSIGIKRRNSSYKNPYKKPLLICMSPQGKTLDNKMLKDLAAFKHLVVLCGHYEGIDERIMNFVDMEISIGDYVLTGGEIPAMVLIDALSRMLPNVVNKSESVANDSFYNGLLDYPHYTRPANFRGLKVPEVLLSGNHAQIAKWRLEQSLERTAKRRPDLFKKFKNKDKIF
jgi:tRNA (guanine37-N1)-methyltransferase